MGDQGVVRQHSLGDLMPVRSIQGSVRWPTNGVSLTGRIFQLESWATLCWIEGCERVDIGIVCVRIIDVEITGVHHVHTIPGIQIGQRSDTGANPACGKRMRSILNSTVVSIVYHELIFMSVAEENVGNHMWGVTVDNLIKEIYPITVSDASEALRMWSHLSDFAMDCFPPIRKGRDRGSIHVRQHFLRSATPGSRKRFHHCCLDLWC